MGWNAVNQITGLKDGIYFSELEARRMGRALEQDFPNLGKWLVMKHPPETYLSDKEFWANHIPYLTSLNDERGRNA